MLTAGVASPPDSAASTALAPAAVRHRCASTSSTSLDGLARTLCHSARASEFCTAARSESIPGEIWTGVVAASVLANWLNTVPTLRGAASRPAGRLRALSAAAHCTNPSSPSRAQYRCTSLTSVASCNTPGRFTRRRSASCTRAPTMEESSPTAPAARLAVSVCTTTSRSLRPAVCLSTSSAWTTTNTHSVAKPALATAGSTTSSRQRGCPCSAADRAACASSRSSSPSALSPMLCSPSAAPALGPTSRTPERRQLPSRRRASASAASSASASSCCATSVDASARA